MQSSSLLAFPAQPQADHNSSYRPEYRARDGPEVYQDDLCSGSVTPTTPIQVEVEAAEGRAKQQAQDTAADEPRTTGTNW